MTCTLKDIAKISGMSVSTVSRALNDSPLIKENTKVKIKKIAESMNFEFNTNARSLIKSKTNTIGIIFANNYYNFRTKTFYSILERHLVDYIEKNGYEAIIQTAANSYTGTSNIKKIVNGQKVDALIVATRDITEEDLEILENSKIPFSFLYYPTVKKKFLKQTFYIDNIKSGALAAKFFYEKGLKNILTITKETEIETNYLDRTKGFLEEAKKFNLNISLSYSGVTFEEGYNFAINNIEYLKKFEGIFCQQDYGALGIIKALNEFQIDIPTQISIVGHDNFEDIIQMFSPKLTTIKQPFQEICINSINYLLNQINEKDFTIKRTFKASIIERES